MRYTIDIPDTPQKKTDLVVIIIDDESKTSSTFALGKNEKHSVALRLIKSAIFKVKNRLWTPTKKTKNKPLKKKPKKK